MFLVSLSLFFFNRNSMYILRNICISDEEFLNHIYHSPSLSNDVKKNKAYAPKTQQLSTQTRILDQIHTKR